MTFHRQEYWSGLPFPSTGDLPDPGIKPAVPALAGRLFTTEPLGKPFLGLKHWKGERTRGVDTLGSSPVRLQWTPKTSPASFSPSLSCLTEDEAEARVETGLARVAWQAEGELRLTTGA